MASQETTADGPSDRRREEDTLKIPVENIASFLRDKEFRILVIGKAQVGKSTIISRVFGVPYVEVQTKIEDIKTELRWPEVNDKIVIHDSGGFEAGDGNEALNCVRDFVYKRKQSPNIEEQIHCIWYCISCTEQLPFARAERYFFQDMDVGQIPIVVAFTKYDLLRHQVRGELDEDDAFDGLSKDQVRRLVEAETHERFERKLNRPFQNLIGRRSIRTERISKPPKNRPPLTGQQGDLDDGSGVKDLVKQTHDVLTHDGLKYLFAAAQRYDADTKLEDSLDTILGVFWRTQGWGMSFILPGISLSAMSSSMSEAYFHTKRQWKIQTLPPNLLDETVIRHDFYYGAFDVGTIGRYAQNMLKAIDIVSVFTSVWTAQHILTYIGCIALIFERLFWLQKDLNDVPLQASDIHKEIAAFRFSEERKRVVDSLRGQLEFWSTKHLRKAECQQMLVRAVKLGLSLQNREHTLRRTVRPSQS